MSFDGIAPYYHWLERVLAGNRLQRARTAWLGELAGYRRILSVGEGHGRFARACAVQFPSAELTCLECSPGMLQAARRHIADVGDKTTWIRENLIDWKPSGSYDAIVTCFFLDCFAPAPLAEVVRKLSAAAAPDAVWLVVDFALPRTGLARWRAAAVHWLMYRFFRIFTKLPATQLTPPDDLLLLHGFHLARCAEFEWGLVRAELWRRR